MERQFELKYMEKFIPSHWKFTHSGWKSRYSDDKLGGWGSKPGVSWTVNLEGARECDCGLYRCSTIMAKQFLGMDYLLWLAVPAPVSGKTAVIALIREYRFKETVLV